MKVTSAWIKKMRKSFKVGDMVTWGTGAIHQRVLEVRPEGVVVDDDGTPFFVRWNGETRITKTVSLKNMLRK